MASLKFLFPILAILCVLLTSEAKEILVGGKENSWTVPPSPDFLDLWAEKIRFRIGDYIIFKYDGKTDSVLEVTHHDYVSCKRTNPIKEYKDGNTKILLSSPGPRFFISGGADGEKCQKGEKLLVVVMSDKHNPSNTPESAPAPAPAPAPAQNNAAAGHGLKLGLVGRIITLLLVFVLF